MAITDAQTSTYGYVAERGELRPSGPDVASTRELLAELIDSPYLVQRKDALAQVSQALGSADAQAWARVDLGLVFSDDSVVDPLSDWAGRRVIHAENARNISILAPLLITWYGIATATWAYGRRLDQDATAARRPFIQLWEQGFDHTAPWWVPTFSFIGLLDFIAIGVVIALSIRVASRRHRLEVDIPESEAQVRNKLRGARPGCRAPGSGFAGLAVALQRHHDHRC